MSNKQLKIIMKTLIKMLTVVGGVVTAMALCGSAQAQTITGWGNESGDVGGTTLVDNGGGSFTLSGTPTGSATVRAALPTAVTLSVGESLEVSGTFSWALTGSMGGGGLRIGLTDYASLGSISGTPPLWSTGPNGSGYFWGLPTGGSGVSNPGGGEITGHAAGGGGSGWFSGNGGGYAVPGTGNDNASDMTPNTYNFSLTLTELSPTDIQIAYSMVSLSYTETGTIQDTSGHGVLTYNGVGFFANTSDTAFGATGGVTFSDLTETITPVPEPLSWP